MPKQKIENITESQGLIVAETLWVLLTDELFTSFLLTLALFVGITDR
jgi:hypothetical protein